MTHKGVVPSHEILSALRSRPRPAVIFSSCRSVLVVGTLPAVEGVCWDCDGHPRLRGVVQVAGIVLAFVLLGLAVRAFCVLDHGGTPTAPHPEIVDPGAFQEVVPLGGSSDDEGVARESVAAGREGQLAVNYDRAVIAEKFIEGTELTAGVLGGQALPLIRLETPREFYDYEAQYVADDTRYILPCGLPAPQEREVQQLCLRAFHALGCRGWGRVDLMLDRDGAPFLLEVNTAPGMTDHSLVPMAARAVGLSYEDLCLRILESAATDRAGGCRVG